jgi:hypothetical protein
MLKINKVNKKNKKEKIKHLPSKQAVEGSNPSAFTYWDKSDFSDLSLFFTV